MIKQRYIIFLTLLFTILIACTNETRPTPTPFAEGTATEQGLNPATTLAVSITDLAADPEAFANNLVEITGRYQRLPLLICDTDANPAPASWQLQAEDGSVIAVGGFDSQLRSLLPNNLTMTVSGVWQLFEGPVGCGKSAITIQIWYLKVSDIISPSPITQVTVTPSGGDSQIADAEGATAVSTSSSDETLAQTPTLTNEGDIPIGTPIITGTVTAELPNGTATFTAVPTTGNSNDDGSSTGTPTPISSSGGSGTATPTSAASPTTGSGSATATPTGNGGGGTGGDPTPTTGVLTTATRDPNDSDNIEFDDLSPEIPVLEFLGTDEVHLWPILFEAGGVITITAVSEPTVDLVLEILDPTDSVVQQANSGGNGALETIAGAQLNVALDYKIRVFDLNGTQGNYCLIFNEESEGGFPDVIRGRIEYGETVQVQIEELAIDYYCFLGEDGDDVTISIVETGSNGNFTLALYGPPDFEAIGSQFTSAEIMNANLEEDGMYLIGLLNFDADAAGYMLTLTKN